MTLKEFNEKYNKIYFELSETSDSYERNMKKYRRNTLAYKNNEMGFVSTLAKIKVLEMVFRDLNSINRNDS